MSRCPDSELLRQLEAGELADEWADQVLPHLERCGACTQTVERFRQENLDARVLRRALQRERAEGLIPDPSGDAAEKSSDSRPDDAGQGDGREGRAWDIPDYERVRLCGEGAFGTVWAVRDRVGVHRALKVIDLARLRSAKARCRESTALEAYCRHVGPHPNLINVFHVGVRGNLLYYTMELADNHATRKAVRDEFPESYRPLTLERVMSRAPIHPDTAIEVVLRLLRGLTRLHAMGMAHRDIKPANIVFVERRPKLSDIGMITADTATPSNVGTPDYMPPDGRMDLTADTYAMGRILYELMVGRTGDDFPRLPRRVAERSEDWDTAEISKVLAKACASAAEDRFQHAERMREEIESCRLWSYDSLFAELDAADQPRGSSRRSPYTPIFVAAINALPWLLGLILTIVLVQKLL
ncbi:MAG: protein kinase domain-containing protein [Planctomycetota bacterium]|jgi:serine/threonine protein kinase